MAKHSSSVQGAATTSALAVAVGVLSNMLLKMGFAIGLSRMPFRRVAGFGLAAMASAALASILVIAYWPR